MVSYTIISQLLEEGGSNLRQARGARLGGLAVFTLSQSGQITSWSATAERQFGYPAKDLVGQDAGKLTAPGEREVLDQALSAVATRGVWTGTLRLSSASGECQVAMHCEPAPAPGAGVLVIAQRLSQPDQDVLASASLIGTSLDLNRTAREITDVAVPEFADAAAVLVSERLLVADELGPHAVAPALVVRRLAVRLADQPSAVVDELFRTGEVIVYGADSPSYRAMTARNPVLYEQLDGETAARIARRAEATQILATYGSYLTAPLIARGVVLGCATFARTTRRGQFTSADVALADEVASRAAVSIDNARLYRRERRTVSALQQGLLPSEPRIPAGLVVAHRYVPVGASVVGGDWHDIVPLPSGKAALIVGDAMGHGPEAAAVMVQLRTAAHTLADLELPPEELLAKLDRLAAGLPAATFATCIAAVIDPSASTSLVAKAGHMPPILALADGTTRMLDLSPGLPLGLGGGSFQASSVRLPPGSTLALYTDGLVESRSRSLDEGLGALLNALASALAQTGNTLDDSCEAVTHALQQHGEDDITLVLARVLDCETALSVLAIATARSAVDHQCDDDGCEAQQPERDEHRHCVRHVPGSSQARDDRGGCHHLWMIGSFLTGENERRIGELSHQIGRQVWLISHKISRWLRGDTVYGVEVAVLCLEVAVSCVGHGRLPIGLLGPES